MRSSLCFYEHWFAQKKMNLHNQTYVTMNQSHDNMDTINSNMNKDYLLAFVNADNNWLILRTDEQLYTVSPCPNKMESVSGETKTNFLVFFFIQFDFHVIFHTHDFV
eukprot:99087_1